MAPNPDQTTGRNLARCSCREVGPEFLDQANPEAHILLDVQVQEPRRTFSFEPLGFEFVVVYNTFKPLSHQCL
ncbi:unnamed protein product [Gulo gulo]|uniref:Uncharacterized protein n=1 Tax=Gulo gulo TaxID=48420 RepID=A0A9X9M8K5_GULGU|nr:unnamed protein product [Gulo gulo]